VYLEALSGPPIERPSGGHQGHSKGKGKASPVITLLQACYTELGALWSCDPLIGLLGMAFSYASKILYLGTVPDPELGTLGTA